MAAGVYSGNGAIDAAFSRLDPASDTAKDAYAAIDGLVDKLDGQIKRHKERLTDHHRGEKASVA